MMWRAVPITLLLAAAGLSCVGDSTGPQGHISGRLALIPSFQSAAAGIVAQYTTTAVQITCS